MSSVVNDVWCLFSLSIVSSIISPDSVRLVNGTSLCSGRLEVKTNQSIQRWSSVCEDDFDQQDAEVVCRELGCGAPSVLQGALYGEVEPPMRTKEFQCGGNESALLDCRSSGSDRNTCSPGKAVGLTCSEPDAVRLVGGASRCAGTLEVKHEGEWRPVRYNNSGWTLKTAAAACRELDCGSAVSVEREESSVRSVWRIRSDCVESGSALRECAESDSSSSFLNITCSDSVRLVNGTSLCSGRLEVKTNQSIQRWSSVCEDDFDQQDAEVVCRELGCGAPSVLQGALYGEVEPPMRTKEFQCGGHESALLDCRSSGSDRNTCSPGKAVGLTCSEPVRLVGAASRCAGTLEVKHDGEWRPVSYYSGWTLKTAAAFCRESDCGSAVSVEREESSYRSVWWIRSDCGESGSALRECAESASSSSFLHLTCSDSVRLVNGTSLCSGRLEVKTNQSIQRWSSVCEDDFDQQDAEVVCRELGCGAPSVLQGALYGEVEPPMRTKEFQCGGHESALLDCRSSGSDRNTCSPGKAVGLTCSEPDAVRLVGGASRCAGTLEVKHNGEWRQVIGYPVSTLKTAAAACRELDCGSAVSVVEREESSRRSVWRIRSDCVESRFALRECAESDYSSSFLHLTCSDSVRLVNGTSLCSGRLEVKTNQSIQRWSSVCEDDFDQQDAEVVCRELGCGAPSVLQGALYGEVEPQVRTKEFQCGGHESALLDCRSSGSDRNTCSPGKAVGLTCSDSVRLVNGTSLCSGRLEVKTNQSIQRWSSVCEDDFDQQDAEVVCRELGCGAPSVLQGALYGEVEPQMRTKEFQCGGHESALLDCRSSGSDRNTCSPGKAVGLTCSESVRLVGGASRCGGSLEVKHKGEWRPVDDPFSGWTLKTAAAACRESDCGSAVSVVERQESSGRSVWWIRSDCVESGSALRECAESDSSSSFLHLTCSDSVRLVNGTSLCSGRLEVKTNQSIQRWSSVCEDDFDQQDAEVVCRELGCGAPSVLQGALYGEVEPPMRTKEFQCGGHESALLDCRSSGSDRNTCSPGKAVGLTCSESVRLVGGASRCAGTLEVKHNGEWRPVSYSDWTLKRAAAPCRELDCGSAVSVEREESSYRSVWEIRSDCVESGSALRECAESDSSSSFLHLTCSDSVRLVNGTSLCSGRLEVKTNQSIQRWSSVCEDDFDQQDAEVVCRELGCGAPSVLQGALYGEVEPPMRTKEFQCGGHESALLDCRSSGSDRNTCSPGKAVGLTCSEPDAVRLVGGASRCAGTLEVKHNGEWRPVSYNYNSDWTLKRAAAACRESDCGSAVSVEREESSDRSVWWIRSDCGESGSVLRECAASASSSSFLHLTCSDSVRLVNGTSLCSGRLEVNTNQSTQRWSSVCEDDFDQQDAEVVCRELGCGTPSVLQGALYGEVEPPMMTKEFQCGGHESALMDCRSSGSDRNTCSPGKAVGLTCSEPVRLVGGDSRCAGTLEVKHNGERRPVSYRHSGWTLKTAAAACRESDCGSAVSVVERKESSDRSMWWIMYDCVHSGSALRECAASASSHSIVDLICSDSVRLVNGTSLCSGRLEVKTNKSTQHWSSVCEDDFDQQDAEVVCRELGCGAPSVLQGALYGEVEPPMRTKEFQCAGHESALLDCRSSGSDRNTCSPGKAVGLTCSESDALRLVGGASRCAGSLELKHHGEWRRVSFSYWTLKTAAAACRELECGSAVSLGGKASSDRSLLRIWSDCVQSGSALRECASPASSPFIVDLTCSDSVRLVNGTSLCSGRLEVKTNQSTQHWSSVCEDDFDQQDAEVVCRELGCGAPSILQGALYGEVEPPMRTKEFQCGGHESALLDCRSSGSDRNTCSPGKAVGLTCSEPDFVRLVGGASRCAGALEVKQGEWRPVIYIDSDWTLNTAAAFCRELDCGSAISVGKREEFTRRSVWGISSVCVQSGSVLRECVDSASFKSFLNLTCSDSVRLVNGTSLCSGRLEVKTNQSTQRWSSVCEDDFDQQDAEVVCRELGCGAPSVLQGALYGEVEAPMRTKEFQCGGNESALLDCRSSGSDRNTCSPGKAVGLTCSETGVVRLLGGDSRCAGTLELKHNREWRAVIGSGSTLKIAAAACRELSCGSAVSVVDREEFSVKYVWKIWSDCVESGSALRECAASDLSSLIPNLTCSDLLLQPNISVSSSLDRVSEAQQERFQVFWHSDFTISCSIQPQYPGGSFQLTFTSSHSAHNSIQPAVNHSAHFLFPAAEPAHQGSYSCVYHLYVFSHNFSSESHVLSLGVIDPRPLIIRAILLPLILLVVNTFLYFYCTANRGQLPCRQNNIEPDYYNLGVPAAERRPTEEEGAQGAE
ncbi:scavenger receptor cysteine-rich type 1 protein M160-like isoform X3 [Sander lucioperca]|uniref:scavenger receptor cysteine-rich type 1 protein M160-like isoform X3 n=1 Tax=Sander lucioperca TaxID=283035 RepID=UPI001653D4B2|nr:scavenger receptor cysteine-rich type 1 protein M160-like isoform X3 [Sander lucioperca]